jgi:hypothetical protein
LVECGGLELQPQTSEQILVLHAASRTHVLHSTEYTANTAQVVLTNSDHFETDPQRQAQRVSDTKLITATLAIALVAPATALGQLLEQYFVTADGIEGDSIRTLEDGPRRYA